jgi:DNA-binding winged helix-turn-helix (wHTH) protein
MRSQPQIIRFDAFELDEDNRELRRDGQPVELGSRYFDALALLLARHGELVTKDAFMEQVWHGIPVTDEALTQCIRTLRRALGDDAINPRFIQTVPKHGYRFIAPTGREESGVAGAAGSLIAGACTLAGLAAGVFAGLLYGMIAGTGGGGQVLILAAMIGALGLLAGAGLGAGMTAIMAWRGRADWWLVVGATIGGLCVGALGNLLGREGVGLLSGVSLSDVTGPFEGAVLGCAVGGVAWAALAGWKRGRIIACALAAGTLAAGLIFLSGGTLLAGSLHALEQGLPQTRLEIANLGALLGEAGMTRRARGVSVLVESQAFVLALALGLLAIRNSPGLVSRPVAAPPSSPR